MIDGQITTRDKWRCTGRTTRILEQAIEHARSVKKPVFFVIPHGRGLRDHIIHLLIKMDKRLSYNNARQEAKLSDGTIIFLATFEHVNSMRDLRYPIYMDHTCWETGARVPEEMYAMQDRIVNWN